jgi:hypothetical protein
MAARSFYAILGTQRFDAQKPNYTILSITPSHSSPPSPSEFTASACLALPGDSSSDSSYEYEEYHLTINPPADGIPPFLDFFSLDEKEAVAHVERFVQDKKEKVVRSERAGGRTEMEARAEAERRVGVKWERAVGGMWRCAVEEEGTGSHWRDFVRIDVDGEGMVVGWV